MTVDLLLIAMNSVLFIKTKGVKDLLSLFNPESVIERVSLGDTWHPSAGYVDESFIEGLHRGHHR